MKQNNPVQAVITSRQSLASSLGSPLSTSANLRKEKHWFKKVIKTKVYERYKFVSKKDKRFSGDFCNSVFKAIESSKNEDEWNDLFEKANAAINELRATDTTRLKEVFSGKFQKELLGFLEQSNRYVLFSFLQRGMNIT